MQEEDARENMIRATTLRISSTQVHARMSSLSRSDVQLLSKVRHHHSYDFEDEHTDPP